MKDKIPFYEIVNKFFVGAVFSFLFLVTISDRIALKNYYDQYKDIMKDFSVISSTILLISMYEVGFIINRLGSITVAPFLEKTGFWPKGEYRIDISEIKKDNNTFNTMILELVLIRSHILIYIILAMSAVICKKCILFIVFLVLILVFILSGRKHNDRINKIRADFKKKKIARSMKIIPKRSK